MERKHKVSGVWRTGIPQRKGKKLPSKIGQQVSSEGEMSMSHSRFNDIEVFQRINTARLEAIEECARLAEGYPSPTMDEPNVFGAAKNIARIIRALCPDPKTAATLASVHEVQS